MTTPIESSTVAALTAAVLRFRDAREWAQFNTPKEMAIALMLEAAELLEQMQWADGEPLRQRLAANRSAVSDELADLLYWVLLLAHDLEIDLAAAFHAKMAQNETKYPVERARGRSAKYTEL